MSRHSHTPAPGKLLTLFRTSVILSACDRFVQLIYSLIQNGFFGRLFSAYPTHATFAGFSRLKHTSSTVRRTVSRTAENSLTLHLLRQFIQFLLRCRTRVYGTFLLTFGIYTALSYILGIAGPEKSAPTVSLILAVMLIGLSLPLLSSNIPLAQALSESRLAAPVLEFLDIRRESLRTSGSAGRSNIALILGMLLGFLSFIVPPLYIVGAILGLILAYRIMVTPELGVALLFFGMPFLPTMLLAAFTAYTFLCLCIKLLLGKRQLQLEAVDASVFAFAVSLLLGGLFSFSSGSLKPTLLLLCFLAAYFLTVLLIRTWELLTKCLWSAILSSSLVALIGIVQYFSGALSSANAWLDEEMFENIAGRAVSTLENPNMLAEYLILLFPLAAAQLLTRQGLLKRTLSFFACALLGVCIILTWSRGAWLGLLFGGLIFLLIWNRRTLYLILAGVLSVPLLPLVLPDAIVQRFTSIGNMGDSSTSYRVNIWRGTVKMLEDYWFTGIGVGEAPWSTVYPRYALGAIEAAPHAHNLYLQTLVQTGIIGLLLLLIFIFILLQNHFSYYRALSSMRDSISDSVISFYLRPAHSTNASLPTEPSPGAGRREITAMRMEAAAPLCGMLATLLQGLTDYTWYNYRVYLMFWLVAALGTAYIRTGRSELERLRGFTEADTETYSPNEAQTELTLSRSADSSKEKGSSSHA